MRAHPDNSKMIRRKIFSALRVSMLLPSAASPPYCNQTTSNLMATALRLDTKMDMTFLVMKDTTPG